MVLIPFPLSHLYIFLFYLCRYRALATAVALSLAARSPEPRAPLTPGPVIPESVFACRDGTLADGDYEDDLRPLVALLVQVGGGLPVPAPAPAIHAGNARIRISAAPSATRCAAAALCRLIYPQLRNMQSLLVDVRPGPKALIEAVAQLARPTALSLKTAARVPELLACQASLEEWDVASTGDAALSTFESVLQKALAALTSALPRLRATDLLQPRIGAMTVSRLLDLFVADASSGGKWRSVSTTWPPTADVGADAAAACREDIAHLLAGHPVLASAYSGLATAFGKLFLQAMALDAAQHLSSAQGRGRAMATDDDLLFGNGEIMLFG